MKMKITPGICPRNAPLPYGIARKLSKTRPWPKPRYNPSAGVKPHHIFGPKTKNCILAPFWPFFVAQVGQDRHKNIFRYPRTK